MLPVAVARSFSEDTAIRCASGKLKRSHPNGGAKCRWGRLIKCRCEALSTYLGRKSITPSVHLVCSQHVRRDAARRAGLSATADLCWDTRADRQTDRHTDTLIAILRPPPRGEVIKTVYVVVYIGWQWRNFFTSAVFRHFVGQALRNVCCSDVSRRHFLNKTAIVRTFS